MWGAKAGPERAKEREILQLAFSIDSLADHGGGAALVAFFFLSTPTSTSPYPLKRNKNHRALYQLQLVPLSEAKKHIPPEFHIVSLFG